MVMFAVAGARLTERLRAKVFSVLMTQEVGYFDDEENTLGAVTSRLATDAASVADMITKVWGDIVQLIATAITGLLIAFIHAWNLSLVSFFFGFLYLIKAFNKLLLVSNCLARYLDYPRYCALHGCCFHVRNSGSKGI
jgi:ABC-type multidrug transport system fused ATPase/permease subunit